MALLVVLFGGMDVFGQSPHGPSLKIDCAQCHSPADWTSIPEMIPFDHDSTGFPLTGTHERTECKSCHPTLVFDEAPSQCSSCHGDVHSMSVGNDCARCHTSTNWMVDAIPELHEQNGFPLIGAHSALSCVDCHMAENPLRFDRIGNDCVSCHQDEFAKTADPAHVTAGFPTDCALCHDESSWNNSTFDHNTTAFPLTGAHTNVNCLECHSNGYAGTPTNCDACHLTDFNSTTDPNHVSAGFSTDCATCHNESAWQPSSFDHNTTGFALTGSHTNVACLQCHANGYAGTPTMCDACHLTDYNTTTDPNHVTAGFPTDCALCHDESSWNNATFDHNTTAFPLTGAHTNVNCLECHSNGYAGTPTNCDACHLTDFNSTTDPNHVSAGFSTDCATCHNESAWQPSSFDHNTTGFPLTGSHQNVACLQCHANGYAGTPTMCDACHLTDYNTTTDPNHVTAGFPTDCALCHDESSWNNATFDHNTTAFPLTGAHTNVNCLECHSNGYTGTPTNCDACHLTDFNSTTDPNHVNAGFSTDCATCHNESAWQPSSFDHNTTGFPLTGSHQNVACLQCHANGYAGTPTTCDACHLTDFNNTTDPNHVTAGFPTDCALCHDESSWNNATFDHNTTAFPLTGAHTNVNCLECHSNGYTGTPTNCDACHLTDFNSTTDPNHVNAGFSTDCATCHNESAWQPSSFDHNTTGFPLTGSHQNVACLQCHANGYAGTPTTCDACHLTDFNNTTDPNHVTAGFPTDCALCHDESSWNNATFDHNTTAFPLTGAHTNVNCLECHSNGYTGTPTNCDACHLTDYSGTTDPNHVNAGFSTDCATCHNESAWQPSTFDHNTTGFPLTGSHQNVACLQCHANGYAGTPTTCDACHLTDFNNTTDPNHVTAGFPTDCALCHDESSWNNATFDHNTTAFPLTGAHTNVNCLECHSNGYAGTPTNCDACHLTDFNSTTDPNHVSAGFSTDCATCHNESAWQPSSFDHNTTGFPLTGSHQNVACLQCHANGYAGTPTTCDACHLTDFNNTTDPNHVTAGFPTDCALCHDESSWNNATFDHNTTAFPLTGAHTNVNCLECHSNGYTGTPTNCDACHLTDYSGTTDPNHVNAGFSTDCATCHNESAWQPSTFDHNTTGFPLTGSHQNVACLQCHANGYAGTPTTCDACHLTDFNNTTDPNHVTAGFPTDCALCHDESSWNNATFDHNTTAFPLTGAHTNVNCLECHSNGYTGTPTNCDACHLTDFNSTTDPNHVNAGFSTDCATCHNESAWQPSSFDHNTTGFPLTGSHQNVACLQCHANGYAGTPTTCDACHLTDFNNTTDPNHVTAGFPTDCALCHDESSWNNATFDHNTTAFPLTGAHTNVNCLECHSNGYAGTPTNCDACHLTDFNSTTDPNHVNAGFSTDCATCHNESAWQPSTFDHNTTGFPLTGSHTNVACLQCHANGYAGTPTTCDACHLTDYNGTTDPNHVTAGFPTDCALCHDESSWNNATFDHNTTAFPLTGAHTNVNCLECHSNGYTGTPTNCDACHLTDFNTTTDPNHTSAGFSTDCATCHNESAWQPSTFDHNTTGFPLTGSHQNVNCLQCHANGYAGTPTTCDACHLTDYNTTTDPNHVTAGFPTDCALCHDESSWNNATFDHNTTAFPLTGAHTNVNCLECHSNGYAGTPTNCDACHLTDFNTTTDPNHVNAGFGTDCATCHNESAWQPSTFDHNTTGFPLQGSHTNVACLQCHANGYAGTPTTCDACHLTDYNTTTDPNHVTAGFPTDCAMCHDESSWNNATFDHNTTGFPLQGAHTNVNCLECHSNGYAGTPTNCDACHLTDFNSTTDPNHVNAGFSTDCATCHNESAWQPSTFDHNTTGFPLTGSHTNVACLQCHANGYAGTPTTCDACHLTDYNGTTDPNHVTAGFPTDCALCHDESSWNNATFDHNTTAFPLTGAHTNVNCLECHSNGYTGTPTNCDACHLTDFNTTTDPNHTSAGFSTDCATCHNESAWQPSTFDHNTTGFPLTGSHTNVACLQCHANGYAGTPTNCDACHLTDFNNTTEPNHVTAGFPTDCALCHDESSWNNATFDHNTTAFPLQGAHTNVNCLECHSNGYAGTPTNCDACHLTDFNSTTDPNHTSAGFSTDCATCHNETAWQPSTFDHNTTGFPLTGSHQNVACLQCHANGYAGTPTTCDACHLTDFNNTTDPNHVTAGFPTDCALCHDESSWNNATFDHNTTAFPLTGAHTNVNCLECHSDGYAGTPTNCDACHLTDFNSTTDPNHVSAGFSTDCATCHNESAWQPSTFDHNTTGFPLTGSHMNVACLQCHANGYAGTPTNCDACHLTDYNGTTDPNHVTAGFPTDCALCHDESSWNNATFDHNTTGFPLQGAHTNVNCLECHSNGYAGTPTNCDACHLTDFNSTTDPNHNSAGFSTDCATCHNESAWQPSTFDHNSTGFPLQGSHTNVACLQCHANGYAGTPTTCDACHLTDYNSTTDPNHVTAGFPTDCAMCHDESSWNNATFDHNTTGFPLQGAHTNVNCLECHSNGYAGTPTNCDACHLTDFNSTTDPNHVNAGFSTDCATCHNEAAWQPSTFDHNSTGFPLQGSHTNVACLQCHANGYAGTPTTCDACHLTDYNTTTDPNHVTAGFPTDCAMCHDESSWNNATFDHNTTGFPLQGAHTNVNCLECHSNGYAGTPTNCDACHLTDYNGTTDPNHVTAGFPTDCAQCHSEAAWQPSTFNHNSTGFPLMGAHTNVNCIECHASGYAGTPTNCEACHMTDYNGTTDPNHVTAGFPTDCATCHTETAWQPSTFNHNNTGFPLQGAHVNANCLECHSNGYAGTPTNCDACHLTDYNGTTDPNHVSAGFPLDCATCHSETAWQPSTFNHNSTGFPLTGAHTNASCLQCHANGYAGTPTNCDACHMTDYNGTNNPDHSAAQFPTDCAECHNTSAWDPSTFNHDQMYFRIYSGTHNGEWNSCTDCHSNPNDFSLFSCIDCHEHSNQNSVNNDHNGVNGYSYNSNACYECHPNGN